MSDDLYTHPCIRGAGVLTSVLHAREAHGEVLAVAPARLVVAYAGHVRHAGCERLNEVHEPVADPPAVWGEIIRVISRTAHGNKRCGSRHDVSMRRASDRNDTTTTAVLVNALQDAVELSFLLVLGEHGDRRRDVAPLIGRGTHVAVRVRVQLIGHARNNM